ncbi:MAG: DUF6580 family putative transport protein [Bacteroidota bacterium]
MNNKKFDLRYGIVIIMILLAALSRLMPHPPNFTPVTGMALFGAAYLNRRWLALVIPLVALWISNLILDNTVYAQYYDGFVWFSPFTIWVYISIAAIVGIGYIFLKKVSFGRVASVTLLASLLFFFVTNFGSWLASDMYPKNASGLLACYIAGIPFYWKTLAGDLFYTGVLFGIFEWMQRSVPALRPANA